MIQHARVTEPLQAVVTSLAPVTFVEVDYTPELLISSAPMPLRKHEEYDESCQVGFEAFFDGLWKFHPDGTSTQRQEPYTYVEAITEVVENLTPDGLEQPPYAYSLGYTLGWLSALALSDRELANQGLEITRLLVSQHVKEMNGRRRARAYARVFGRDS